MTEADASAAEAHRGFFWRTMTAGCGRSFEETSNKHDRAYSFLLTEISSEPTVEPGLKLFVERRSVYTFDPLGQIRGYMSTENPRD